MISGFDLMTLEVKNATLLISNSEKDIFFLLLLVSHLRLSQWMDDTGEGYFFGRLAAL